MASNNDDTDTTDEQNDRDLEAEVPQGPVASDPSTWEGDRPPEDAIATEDDFKVKRDPDTGEVEPIWEPVPGTGKQKWAHVKPARQGDAEKYLPESGQLGDMSDRQIVRVLNRFFEEPDFDIGANADPEQAVADFTAFGLEPLLMAWANASGFDYQMGMVGENADLVRAVEGNSSPGS